MSTHPDPRPPQRQAASRVRESAPDWQQAALTGERVAATAQQRAAGLIAQVTRLRDKIAVLAKTVDNLETVLGLEDGQGLPLWRAEIGRIPLGTYLAPEAAARHCLAAARRDPTLAAADLRWVEAGPEPGDQEPMHLYASFNGEYVDTGYVVTPFTALADYDPDGDE